MKFIIKTIKQALKAITSDNQFEARQISDNQFLIVENISKDEFVNRQSEYILNQIQNQLTGSKKYLIPPFVLMANKTQLIQFANNLIKAK